jgi:alanyl-tRNA synthetase
MRTAAEIRAEFIAFFRDRHGHAFAPSSPVVPLDDPTLLFTNAGMNQFKDVFLGRGSRPYRRAVNSQKCIRAGGKHNDLEDVGTDTYHHTFFEMLGNWSFGDYFKAEAIAWAWELLTKVWKLDPSRLHVTVFAGSAEEGLAHDDEAESLWRCHLPADRISRWGKKDNFWEMGETGPCGPCSEIHYDSTPDGRGGAFVNRGRPDVIEIWNLVFIQFNRTDDGRLVPLPASHVDTGMGLERVARVIQGKTSNYDTDLWSGIFAAIADRSGARPYGGSIDDPVDVAYRVIADHARCLTVAITDGARPGSDGRSYVLRRILRRAVRHARQTLGVDGPMVHAIVPAVVASLGGAFPELTRDPKKVSAMIREEEESFLRTLDRGIELFEAAAARCRAGGATSISGADAFLLHDTYGFPIDLTAVLARERGLVVDEPGYEALMDEARRRSREGAAAKGDDTLTPDAISQLQFMHVKPTEDVDKYHGRPVSARVKAIWNGRDFDDAAHIGHEVAIVLDRTNHYAEAGGQVGDHGRLESDIPDSGALPGRGYTGRAPRGECRFEVSDTTTVGGYVLHHGRIVDGTLHVGDEVMAMIDRGRRLPTMANHTATHLLNHALRAVLGTGVDQRGSLVAPDRLRFDFSLGRPVAPAELAEIEQRVRDAVARDMRVAAEVVPLAAAQRIHGVRAVFGERYPDPVRVVSIGAETSAILRDAGDSRWREYSIEFCGGTHLSATAEAAAFTITQESALAAGVRRLAALTGAAARAADLAADDLERRIAELGRGGPDGAAAMDEVIRSFEALSLGVVRRARLEPAIEALRRQRRELDKGAQREARKEIVERARRIADAAAGEIVVEIIRAAGADQDVLLAALDVLRERRPGAAAMLVAPDEAAGKVAIVAAVPKPLIARGLKAGDWVREAAKACGGGGGGRPDVAQAGGKDPAKADRAVAIARDFARARLESSQPSPS